MENIQNTQAEQADQSQAVNAIYNYAANMLVNENKTADEVQAALVEKGLSSENAATVVRAIEDQIYEAKRSRASKDMLYGALWCVGGIIATAIGYSSASGGGGYMVFYGAIIFGAIQFFRGVINSSSN